jgi:hypothetical protein
LLVGLALLAGCRGKQTSSSVTSETPVVAPADAAVAVVVADAQSALTDDMKASGVDASMTATAASGGDLVQIREVGTFVTTKESAASHARIFITNTDRALQRARIDSITYMDGSGSPQLLSISSVGVDDMVKGDLSGHWRGNLARVHDEIEIAAGREVMVTINVDSSALPSRLERYDFAIALTVDGKPRKTTAGVSRAERLRER